MLLVRAAVGPFKSIETPSLVDIDPRVTVLVGMNEAGKTAFLQALHKSKSVDKSDSFDPVADYPRRSLTSYLKEHNAGAPADVVRLVYRLTSDEIIKINSEHGTDLKSDFGTCQ